MIKRISKKKKSRKAKNQTKSLNLVTNILIK